MTDTSASSCRYRSEDLKQGRLVEVLRRFNGRTNRFSLLRGARRVEDRATSAFARALIEYCTRGAV